MAASETARVYKSVLSNAVKRGKGVKDQVLEDIAVEKELENEREIRKEVERELRKGDLAEVKYPEGEDGTNPITLVRNPEDEVYGSLPMDLKVDLDDAVDFMKTWGAKKDVEMRPEFMKAHLLNKRKDEYFYELKKRLEKAKREGNKQVVLPMPTQGMMEDMKKSEEKESKDNGNNSNDLAAIFAPLMAYQQLIGGGAEKGSQEKPAETVKAILDAAKEMSTGKGDQEKPAETVKAILEAAKEMSTGNDSSNNPVEMITAVLTAAQAIADTRERPEPASQPDIISQIQAVSELTKTMAGARGEGGNSENMIQIPREDGTMVEMTLNQYLLTEMLKSKLSGQQQTGKVEQGGSSDQVVLTDAEGQTRKMSATTYISEMALTQMAKEKEREKEEHKSTHKDQAGNEGAVGTKLLAQIVASVERLSSKVSQLESDEKKKDPLSFLEEILSRNDEVEGFKKRFFGGGLTDEDKKREEGERERERKHELELAKIETRKAQRAALAELLSNELPPDTLQQQPRKLVREPQPQPQQQQQAQSRAEEADLVAAEQLEQSKRKAEQIQESLEREVKQEGRQEEEGASPARKSPPKKRQQKKPATATATEGKGGQKSAPKGV